MAIFFLLQPAPLPAVSPPAMRVDVQPSAITAEGTMMTIEVQLAPQDRGRIGRQARMRIKLNQGSKALVHILQDVDFDDRGMTRMEYLWPPGSYELLLTIESLRGTATGLWVGPVVIPESLDQTPAAPPPEPKLEELKTESKTPVKSSLPDAASAAPVVASAPPTAKAPVTETKKTVGPVPPPQAPIQASETIPENPEPSTATPATEPSPTAAPAAKPTPVPEAKDEVPTPHPGVPEAPKNSGPVYALVLDIDPLDLEIADRTAELRASIDRHVPNVTPIVVAGEESNPAEALMQGLDPVRSHTDARAIIVITDARNKASRSQWKAANASIESAGLRIFVITLWNDEFNPGTRKQLSLLATKSGGRSYVLQPAESPARALEMLDTLLSAD